MAEAGDRLTPTERRIANLILDDSTRLAFDTVAELAERVGTSGPTIVRFATKLGFDGYGSLQQEARRLLSEQLDRPSDRIRHQPTGDVWHQARATATQAVEAAFESVSAEKIQRLAAPIVSAKGHVWIVGSENSATALALANGLRLLRPGVRLLTGSRAAIASDLTEASSNDTVVAIDFSRYERAVVRTTKTLVDLGATAVVITDGAFSPLTALADVWCEITIPAIGPFDSALPAISVVETLVAEVAHRLTGQATTRIDRAETLWSAEDIFISSDS